MPALLHNKIVSLSYITILKINLAITRPNFNAAVSSKQSFFILSGIVKLRLFIPV